MMKKFKYSAPKNIEEAILCLSKEEKTSRILAGGTDIIGALNMRISPDYPEALISLKSAGLRYIREDAEGIRIGAMATLHEIESDPVIARKIPLLKEAARSVASPQIRHRATVGGNLCQEPRCWYYRYQDNKFNCMRKGGNLCNAFTGNNLYHSVFGPMKTCTSPCENGCPNETNIPAYLEAMRSGDYDKAAKIFLQVNPLGAATGRVCPHTCQDDCNRNEFDESVSIRNIERFIGDYILENAGRLIDQPAKNSGKKIAIVGGGPAGLTAAYFLRLAGHDVTVFDKNERAGGMLRYAIPSYRLPASKTEEMVQMIENLGVRFVLGDAVDPKAKVSDYKKDFDSVLLSHGAWKDNKIEFDGSERAISGLDFLYDVSNGKRDKPGSKVVVIGGGNVAIDAAVTAKHLGSDVTIVYRRTKGEMPAHKWEVEEAVREGIVIKDSVSPYKILDKDGTVVAFQGVACISGGSRDSKLTLDYERITTIEADCIIMAVGQKVDDSLKTDSNCEDIFSAGDAVTGPKTVVEAIAGGRKSAYSIHKYLTGQDYADSKPPLSPVEIGEALTYDENALKNSFSAKSNELNKEKAAVEASRCFNCGCVAVTPSDLAPALVALGATMVTTSRSIPASEFFGVGIGSSTVLDKDEILKEVFIPEKNLKNVQWYQKFRTRKSIDFPIASLAANMRVENGKIAEVKLVLGGAAPTPYLLHEVESYLTGKEINDKAAREAGEIAIKNMKPLAENAFKIQVFKALVKRAVTRGICN